MSETLYTLTATHGVGIVVICAYLSCLAIPIPTSLVMLAGSTVTGGSRFPFLLPKGIKALATSMITEDEPEHPDYPKDPAFREQFGPRGVIHSFSDGRI